MAIRSIARGRVPSLAQLDQPPRVWPAVLVAGVTALLLTAAMAVDVLPRSYEVREGDVAAFSIRAPRKASYVSPLRTKALKEQAAAQVQPIIELDYAVVNDLRRGQSELLQAINAVRGDASRPASQRWEAIRGLTAPPLSDTTARRIAELDDARWNPVAAETQRLLNDALKDRIAEDAVESVRQTLPLRVSPLLGEQDRAVAVELAQRFVRANLTARDEATQKARQEAQDAIAPVVQMYERGQTVVRDGQVIGPLEIEALQALGLTNPGLDWRSLAATGVLAFTLVGLLSAFVWHFDRELLYRDRRMVLLGTLIVVTAVAAKMVIPGRPLWVYVFPLPAVAMLVSALLDARLAVLIGVILSTVLAWIAGGSLEIGAIAMVGSVTGALAVWRKERLHSFFLAAAYVAVGQIAVYLAFFLANRLDDWSAFPIVAFELGVNGLLSTLLVVGSVALVGRVFGILTTMHLLELANPTQPLLRRLLMEAPGTYHHSIMVGNLAERAAELIGADSLLVRVAAYYHDVGKLERPWAFVENQTDDGENIHESLDPAQSARIISAHVTDGVKLAERYGLPARIREMIPQHHGTRLISFFYQQAAEHAVEDVDPAPFTYAGPRPQSREAAILMLADSTEAAARAARDHSRDGIERLVDHIIRQRLEEGQFDDCNLTLRDLTRIKLSFVTLLTGIYHPRIPYPASAGGTGDAASLPAEAGVTLSSDVSV